MLSAHILLPLLKTWDSRSFLIVPSTTSQSLPLMGSLLGKEDEKWNEARSWLSGSILIY